MNTKIISIKLTETLIAEIDEVVSELDYDRSKWIRFLIRKALREKRAADRESEYYPPSGGDGGGQSSVDPA